MRVENTGLGEDAGHLGSAAQLLASRHGVVPVPDTGVALQVGVVRPVYCRPQTFRRRALSLTQEPLLGVVTLSNGVASKWDFNSILQLVLKKAKNVNSKYFYIIF